MQNTDSIFLKHFALVIAALGALESLLSRLSFELRNLSETLSRRYLSHSVASRRLVAPSIRVTHTLNASTMPWEDSRIC